MVQLPGLTGSYSQGLGPDVFGEASRGAFQPGLDATKGLMRTVLKLRRDIAAIAGGAAMATQGTRKGWATLLSEKKA